jgi:hypothetical protein
MNGQGNDDPERPLAAALLQEFQALKDKFKTDDDEYGRGKYFCKL